MTPAEMATAHTAAIRCAWRRLDDHGGQPPRELLDDLAAIAARHAADVAAAAAVEAGGRKPRRGTVSPDVNAGG